MLRVLIFIPTYNENENVQRLHTAIQELRLHTDILFMDDHSPDGTGETLDLLAKKYPNIFIVHRQKKLGIGSAHRDGISYAYVKGYDLLITLDSDFSHNPSDIPRLLAAHNDNTDVVVGSRYLHKHSLPNWHLHRKFLTHFGHFLTKTFLHMPYDASGALRLYDLRRIPKEIFCLTTTQSYPFFFESLFILHLNGYRIQQIPIVLPSRVYGNSKLTFKEAIRSGCFLFNLFLMQFSRPEKFKLGRSIDQLRPELSETQGWDNYWAEKNQRIGVVYDFIATLYRQLIIKANLKRFLNKHFIQGSYLLHAGCGSGQVDTDLHQRFCITAIDISKQALELYTRNNPQSYRAEQANIFQLPFKPCQFDGIYNMGVLEHFHHEDNVKILKEFHRVLRPNGKIVLFWPHYFGSSVAVLKMISFLMRIFLPKNPPLHPEEISLIKSKQQVCFLMGKAGFTVVEYYFGFRDFFVQSVIVAIKQ